MYGSQVQNGNGSNKKVIFELKPSKYLPIELPNFPISNPKATVLTIESAVAIYVTEFKGRKYLWYRSAGKKSLPEGALVYVWYRTGSHKHASFRFEAIFMVKEGSFTTEITNEVDGSKEVFEFKNLKLVKEITTKDWDSIEAEYLTNGYSLSRYKKDKNLLAYLFLKTFKQVTKETKKEAEKDVTYSEIISKLKELEEELEKEVETPKKEVKEEEVKEEEEEEEKVVISKNEVIDYLKREGLVQVKLVTFDLPSEYKGAKTTYEKTEDGKVREVKVFSNDPTVYRTLRRKFYRILERSAFKSTAGWILRSNANVKELNDVIAELNKLAGTKRNIWIIETYMPKDYVVHQLEQYIKERELALQDIQNKLQLEKLKKSQKKQLEKRLEEIEDIIKSLKKELEKLKR